jgi:D-2-hydroxyacid dehydrogenase (NADP+)
MNVLILETYADRYADRLRQAFPDLTVYPVKGIAELAPDLASIDVLIAFGMGINDDLIRQATRLKWIQSLATGVDHFIRCPSLRPDVLLTSGRGIHGPAMRETVAYLMLSLTHDTPRVVKNQAEHRWDRSRPWPLLADKTAVVVGVGLSSIAIGRLLKAFGMRVIGVTRAPRKVDGFDAMMPTESLPEAVAQADYLINILPGDAHNAGLIGRQVFSSMKPTAFFVNVGRGETVDEMALLDALTHRRIAGAGLDVFAKEPLPGDSPLWDLPNVFLTSHIGGLFREYEDYVMPILIENMRLFLLGRYDEMRNRIAH